MGIEFGRVVPVLRIFSIEKAREFYLGYLGFSVNWEHRFDDRAPLYMQVSRAGVVLHLSEHHGDSVPGTATMIYMTGIAAFHAELRSRDYRYLRPGILEQDWGLRELHLIDPFGNRLRFAEPMAEAEQAERPVGAPVPGWTARPRPPRTPMEGRFCRVAPLDVARHAADLHAANVLDATGANWTYLAAGPPADFAAYRAWLEQAAAGDDPLFHAIIDTATGKAVGVATYMRIDPANGVIEVGNINFSPLLQRHPAATEAMALMMGRVFNELGYRRYEWKCDNLNAPSRAAALRLGFRFEGVFRQALVYKGRNRDTAWFSVIDGEWPALRQAFAAWLDPANFDAAGRQRTSLAALRAAVTGRPHD